MAESFVLPRDPKSYACWASVESDGGACRLTVFTSTDTVLHSVSGSYGPGRRYLVADNGRVIYDLEGRRLLCAGTYGNAAEALHYEQDAAGNNQIAGIKLWNLPYTHAVIGPVEALEILEEAKRMREAPVAILDVLENMATETTRHPRELLELLGRYELPFPGIEAGDTDPRTDAEFAAFFKAQK
ncbi:MAG: hypothetical protein J4431_00060 [Candidatus Aenigmarchaeota archaeon]|nr:hypothetical protein [Candidatus Aenigmarchaeota archaeon]